MTKKFNTRAIHGGQEHDPQTGAVMPPIYTSSTYAQQSPGVHKGFEYGRSENPTRQAYERCLASLEGGAQGYAFASGLAAESAILDLLDAGSHMITTEDLYGGSYRLFTRIKARTSKLDVTAMDVNDTEALTAAIQPNTKMLWIETPTNPLLQLVDLAKVIAVAKQHGLIVVVDNTFSTPYNQTPFDFGADLVMHSATKYLNGHCDIIGGAVVAKEDGELAEQLRFLQFAVGAIASPFDCFLALRGLKTLALRMQCHNENGLAIAQYLADHKHVEEVIYPGLPNHPQHTLANQQMRGFTGMVSLRVKGGYAETARFLENLQLFTLAESLGGVESLACHPARMTHASIPEDRRALLGIGDNLVRLSVGIEDQEDLIADLAQALQRG